MLDYVGIPILLKYTKIYLVKVLILVVLDYVGILLTGFSQRRELSSVLILVVLDYVGIFQRKINQTPCLPRQKAAGLFD